MRTLTRQAVAEKLGRRVSKGEFERMFAGMLAKPVVVQSESRGRRPGVVRVTLVRHPWSPKARRKRDFAHDGTGKRARYS